MKIENHEIIEKLNVLEDQRMELVQKQKKLLPALFLLPITIFAISISMSSLPPQFIIPTVLAVLGSFTLNHFAISSPFKKIKEKVRAALIAEFMETYHPDTSFKYSLYAKDGKDLVGAADLIYANRYHEEDVIEGSYKGANYYISEMTLKVKKKKSSTTVFKGMIMYLDMPGKNFPVSRIQSKIGLLKKWFSGFEQEEEFGFWYDTDDGQAFYKELKPLFPFIKHLMNKQGDIRISTKGSRIMIMMESDMKFLDTPAQRLRDSFFNQEYFKNMAKQLNSLLFMMDAFINNLNTEEIEDRLELYELKVAEKILRT